MDTSQIQDSYKSIAAPSDGLFKDNGSRFIARAYPVETEEEVKEIVAALKKEYYDARHHVYAYRLGYKGDRFRANDDGEPSGSSGRPVLGQIDSLGLSDILVVVNIQESCLDGVWECFFKTTTSTRLMRTRSLDSRSCLP